MANKLLIIMVNTDPGHPTALSAPFFQATVAAAMEYDVEIILTGSAGELAIKGVAEKIALPQDSTRTVYDIMKDAHEAGAHFKTCMATIEQWGEEMIPEIEETVGGAYLISEAMDENTVTFTY
ncbi:MAG: peroxiredoxin [Gammaproteobacteria bacterium]|nr:peroxiredoxin [Gammaproteobacteria bacterium]